MCTLRKNMHCYFWMEYSVCIYSVQFSRSVVSDSLQPHESQHARLPCPSPTPGVHSDSHPSSQWCHPAISSSVVKRLDLIECLKNYGWRFITLYSMWWLKPSPRKRNARRQNVCLRRHYKELRKEVKGNGERERYTQLNAELQRIARWDEKTLSD